MFEKVIPDHIRVVWEHFYTYLASVPLFVDQKMLWSPKVCMKFWMTSLHVLKHLLAKYTFIYSKIRLQSDYNIYPTPIVYFNVATFASVFAPEAPLEVGAAWSPFHSRRLWCLFVSNIRHAAKCDE